MLRINTLKSVVLSFCFLVLFGILIMKMGNKNKTSGLWREAMRNTEKDMILNIG